jgi:hypothetical protein
VKLPSWRCRRRGVITSALIPKCSSIELEMVRSNPSQPTDPDWAQSAKILAYRPCPPLPVANWSKHRRVSIRDRIGAPMALLPHHQAALSQVEPPTLGKIWFLHRRRGSGTSRAMPCGAGSNDMGGGGWMGVMGTRALGSFFSFFEIR